MRMIKLKNKTEIVQVLRIESGNMYGKVRFESGQVREVPVDSVFNKAVFELVEDKKVVGKSVKKSKKIKSVKKKVRK